MTRPEIEPWSKRRKRIKIETYKFKFENTYRVFSSLQKNFTEWKVQNVLEKKRGKNIKMEILVFIFFCKDFCSLNSLTEGKRKLSQLFGKITLINSTQDSSPIVSVRERKSPITILLTNNKWQNQYFHTQYQNWYFQLFCKTQESNYSKSFH